VINSRKLTDLLPEVQDKAQDFQRACVQQGIEILITSTFRDDECQAALYAQGRTTPGKVVTNAKPGSSFHNYRCAFDWVPMVNGKPAWDDHKLFERCGKIAEQCGLEWAGRWTSFPELAHCQFTGGRTIAQLRTARNLA
jgi:peptidoglycan L-alanyl-D-glutamate endopeptidase CwlK